MRGKDSRIMQQLLGMAGFSPNLLPGVPGRGDKPFTQMKLPDCPSLTPSPRYSGERVGVRGLTRIVQTPSFG